MKLCIFGLSVTSSWGNGHATLWRGLARALASMGHTMVFFERDVPFYAANRDLDVPPACQVILYRDWRRALPIAARELASADVGVVTSYCPDAAAAQEVLLESRARVRAFYDLDTPITLDGVARDRPVPYIGPRGLRDYDLVLSFAGGRALEATRRLLFASRVLPLYGSVDPDVYRPASRTEAYAADLSYLGTYAEDRQKALRELFLEPARSLPDHRFVVGGSLYPEDFPWSPNVSCKGHIAPAEHAAFYCSSPWTLHVTRRAMADFGYCPSARLFEAAACGTPIITDAWDGLARFFTPDKEIIVAKTAEDVTRALAMTASERAQIGAAARRRALSCHTARARAEELVAYIQATLAEKESA